LVKKNEIFKDYEIKFYDIVYLTLERLDENFMILKSVQMVNLEIVKLDPEISQECYFHDSSQFFRNF